MANLFNLARRADAPEMDQTMVTLLTVLLVLAIAVVLLSTVLLYFRHRKRALKAKQLPMYSEKRISTSSAHSHHRRVTARPSQSIHIYHEKEFHDDSSEPSSPNSVPEIRITFPDDVDASGKRQSGRVVVVHVGDNGVGLGPVETLPSYQQHEGDRFQSIDLERIGGLDEKSDRSPLGWQ